VTVCDSLVKGNIKKADTRRINPYTPMSKAKYLCTLLAIGIGYMLSVLGILSGLISNSEKQLNNTELKPDPATIKPETKPFLFGKYFQLSLNGMVH
jgi:hypothetical protein